MTAAPRSTRQRSIVVIGAFLYLWVMVGVALATLTLLGPMTWMTGRSGWRTWPYGAGALSLLMLLLVSFVLTRWLLRRTLLSRSTAVRAAIPAVVTLIALAGAWAWLAAAEARADPDVSELDSAPVRRPADVRAGERRPGEPRISGLRLEADERLLTDERLLLEEPA